MNKPAPSLTVSGSIQAHDPVTHEEDAAHNCPMDTDATGVKAALADISDDERERSIDATYTAPQTGPGLLAWIDSTCN